MKPIRIEGDWTQATVPGVLADWRRLVAAGTLDLSGVGHVDSAAASLLLELTRRARAEGQTLTFVNPPANLARLLEFFGIAAMLNGPNGLARTTPC